MEYKDDELAGLLSPAQVSSTGSADCQPSSSTGPGLDFILEDVGCKSGVPGK